MDDFASKTNAFIAWLSEASVNVSTKISLQDLREKNAGRGVVATQDIDADEILFTVPRTSILSADNSDLLARLPDVFEDLNPWNSIILVMMYEYAKGASSKWRAYFDILPEDFDTLMFWSEVELAELQASAVRNKIGKEGADESFKASILPILREHASIFPACQNSPDSELLAVAHRMGTLVMAYAFDVEKPDFQGELDEEGFAEQEEDEDLPKGMVPLADMLNADADRNNARLFYEEDTLVMKALQPISAGEELFNDYGPLPRSDLLRRYGYTTDNYAKFDVVEVPHDLIVSTLRVCRDLTDGDIEERMSYLDEETGIIDHGYDISRLTPGEPLQECFSPELIFVASALLQPATDFRRMKDSAKLPKIGRLTGPLCEWLLRLVEARKAQYATTIADDTALLQDPNLAGRQRLAVKVRHGEKDILNQAGDVLHVLLNEGTVAEGREKRKAPQGGNDMGKRARAS